MLNMPRPLPPSDSDADANNRAALRGVDVGMHLMVSVMVCGALGYALDRWLGWAPWAMLVGGFLGFGAWLLSIWRMMNATRK